MNETASYYQSQTALRNSEERASFVKKTYLNLALAVAAFAGLEAFLLSWPPALELAAAMTQGRNWLIVMLALVGVSWLASSMSQSPKSLGVQYAGLALYVGAMAVVMMPLLILANQIAPDTIIQAAVLTGAMTVGLTCTVIFTGSDFSFLRSVLAIGFPVSLGIIVCAVIFGFDLGLWFSAAMIALASASILYETNAIFKNYRGDQYVAAALGLFSSVVMLYFYILRVLLSQRR